jgi:hypothetical protein
MSRRGVVGVVVLALFLACGGWQAYASTGLPDYQEYRSSAADAAQSAHDALRTARLTGQALLNGRSTGTYAAAVFDDATESLSLAVKDFAGEVPPDVKAAALRDQLAPLFADAVRLLGDVVRAADSGDRSALRAAVPALDPVADRLGDFVERNG